MREAIKKILKFFRKRHKSFDLDKFSREQYTELDRNVQELLKPIENPKRFDSVFSPKPRRLRIEVLRNTSTPKKIAYGSIAAAVIVAAIFSYPILFKAKPSISAATNNAQFSASSSPSFNVRSGGLIKAKGLKSVGKLRVGKSEISAIVTRNIKYTDKTVMPIPEIVSSQDGSDAFSVNINKPNDFKPGAYKVHVTIKTPKVVQTLEQDFKWGVLAMNPDKGIYTTGDQANIAIGVLDDDGRMVCDAKVSLQVIDPAGKAETLSTEKKNITISEYCTKYSNDNPVPDYFAKIQTNLTGKYILRLHAETKNGVRDIEDGFIVQDKPVFDVQREALTRIWPSGEIPSSFKVTANTSFTGKIEEQVPSSFLIKSGRFGTRTEGNKKILTWDVNFKQGETQKFTYYYSPPPKSPEFYLSGPLSFSSFTPDLGLKTIFEEPRQWETASDAACTASVGGAWALNATWGGGGACGGFWPGYSATSDTAAINNGIAVTIGANVANPIASLTINTGATATSVTFSGAYTLNVTAGAGTVTINQPSAAVTKAINVNTGTLNTAGNVSFPGTNTTFNYIATVVVTTGLLDVGGQISFANTTSFLASNAVVSLNSSGTLRIRGAETQYCGTIRNQTTAGTIQFDSSWSYNAGTGCVSAFSNIASSTTKLGGNLTIGTQAGGQIAMNATSSTEITNSLTMTNNSSTISYLGNVTIMSGATLSLGSNNWYILGNWTNNSAASGVAGLTPNTYAVHFRGVSKTIGGTAETSFYDLIIGAPAQITANTSFTVTHDLLFAVADSSANNLTLGSSGVIATVAQVTHSQPTLALTSAFNVNAGTLTVSGTYYFLETTTTTSRISSLVLTTGTINLNGATSLSGGTTPACHTINLSGGAGTLNVAGSIANSAGNTINPGTTSTVNFNGTSAQTIPMGTSGGTRWGACTTRCYANLTITNTNASGATLGNTLASGNLYGNLTVGNGSSAAIFSNGGYNITGVATGQFSALNNATFNMTGSSTFPTGFNAFSFNAGSTVNYQQSSATTVIAVATYGNLNITPQANNQAFNFAAGTTTVAGAINLNTTAYTGITDSLAVNLARLVLYNDLTIPANTTLTANSNQAYYIEVGGNWSNSGTFTHNNGLVYFTKGSNTQTVNSGGAGAGKTFYDVTHNGSGTMQLITNAISMHTFTNSGGTFDGNNQGVFINGGNWVNSANFTSNFTLYCWTGNCDITSGGGTFGGLNGQYSNIYLQDVTIVNSGISTTDMIIHTNNNNLTIGGSFDCYAENDQFCGIEAGTGNTVKIAGGMSMSYETAGGSGTEEGVNILTPGTSTFIFNPTSGGPYTISTGNQLMATFYNVQFGETSGSIVYNTGFIDVASGGSMNVTQYATIMPANTGITIGGAGSLSGAGTVRVTRVGSGSEFSTQYPFSGTRTLTNLTVEYYGASGTQTITPSLTYGNLKITPQANSLNFNFGGGTTTVGGVFTMSNGTSTGTNVRASINSTTLIINNDFVIPANTTFTAHASNALQVKGAFTNTAGGTFNANGGTVQLNAAGGTTQAVSGNTTFQNLQLPNAGTARTVSFANSSTTTVSGTFTAAGASSQLLTLRSANSSTPNWAISAATANVSYAQVNYSTASGAASPFCATYSPNGTGDTNWNFSSGATCITTVTVSGSIYTSDAESTKYTATTPTVGIKVNGSGSATCSNTSGDFSCPNVTINTIGDTVTVYIDDASVSGATVTRAGSTNSDITGLHIHQNMLIVRHEDAGPVTNADIDDYDSNNNANLKYTVATNNLTFTSAQELHVGAGDTYTPGGNVTTYATSGSLHIPNTATMNTGTNNLTLGTGLATIDGSLVGGASGTWTVNGALTMGASSSITATGGTWTQTAAMTMAGTFSPNGGTVTIDPAANIAVDFNDFSFNNLNLYPQGSTGQLTLTTHGVQVDGNLVVGAGGEWGTLVNPATPLVVEVNDDITVGSGYNNLNYLNVGGTNLTFRFTGAGKTLALPVYVNFYSNTEVAATGSITFSQTGTSSSKLCANGGSVLVQNGGQLTLSGAVTTETGCTLTNHGTFNGGTGTVILGSSLTSDGAITSTTGTMTVNGSFTNSGTFTHSGGTVAITLVSGATSVNPGGVTFNNLEIRPSTYTITVDSGFTTAGTLSLGVGTRGTISNPALPTVIYAQGAVTMSGFNSLNYVTIGGNNLEIQMSGSGNANISQTYTNFYSDLKIAKTSNGVVSLATALNMAAANQKLTVDSGILSTASYGITLNGASSQFYNNDTLRVQGGETLTITTKDTNSGTVEYIGTGVGNFTSLNYGTAFYHLKISGAVGDAFANNASTTVNGDFVLTQGTYTTNGALNVNGNWTRQGGVFTPSTQTVTLSGTNNTTGQVVSGNTSFYDLTISNGGTAAKYVFNSGTATTVTHNFNAIGAAGNLITLDSNNTSTWTITAVSLNTTLDYLDVSYSVATNNLCADHSQSTRGNNTNWSIGGTCTSTYSGSIYSDEGSVKYTTAVTVGIKVNGGGSSTCTNTSGDFTCPNVRTAGGDTITIYLDSASVSGALVSRAASAADNISGMNIYQNRLIMRHEDAGPVTNADIDDYDSNNNANLRFTVASNNLTFTVTTQELHIWTGEIYTPGGSVTTSGTATPAGDLHNAGTLNMGANALTITGTINNSGTISAGSGTWTTAIVTNNNGGTITGTSNTWSASGAFNNNGTLALGSGTLDTNGAFTNGVTGVISGSSGAWNHSMAFTNSGSLTLSGTNTFTIDGGGAGNFNFDATGATFNNFVVNRTYNGTSYNIYLISDFTISGDIDFQMTGSYYLDATVAGRIVTVGGNLTTSTASQIRIGATDAENLTFRMIGSGKTANVTKTGIDAKLVFDGSTTLTSSVAVNGSSSTYSSTTINQGKSLTIGAGGAIIDTPFTNNGSLDPGSGTLDTNGAFTNSATGTVSGSAGTWNHSVSFTNAVGGSFTLSGTSNFVIDGSYGTYTYNGNGATFNNMTINRTYNSLSYTVSLQSDFTVAGNIDFMMTGSCFFTGSSAGRIISIGGNVTTSTASQIRIGSTDANNLTLRMTGSGKTFDVTKSGIDAKLIFDGSTTLTSSVAANGTSLTYSSVTVSQNRTLTIGAGGGKD